VSSPNTDREAIARHDERSPDFSVAVALSLRVNAPDSWLRVRDVQNETTGDDSRPQHNHARRSHV